MDNKYPPQQATLTEREREVLRLIAQGLSTNGIAEQLVLSPHTIAWYVKQIFRKLDVSRRAEAVLAAYTLGMLDRHDLRSDSLNIGGRSKLLSNLPNQPTALVGRQDEITQIVSMLDDRSCRLLTLVGPGGIGKTRLALAVAVSRLDHANIPVCFIALQPLTSHEDIVPTIASSLGIRLQVGGGDLLNQLCEYLHGKAMLLIMDILEHLLDGVSTITSLLAATSRVQILATSRESLNLREEHLFNVEGLRYPDHSENMSIEEFSAVRLFAERAAQLYSDFSPNETLPDVIRICQLVSGMPLALELASSWVKTLSCGQIAAEIKQGLDLLASPLRNMPERHRSMRVVFDYSWKMLSDVEQAIFERLSVFRGGCTLDAARYVADADLGVLQVLVDKSFISFDQTSRRYNMHELLRQYGESHLEQSSNHSTGIHDKHCAYYVEFLVQRREYGFGHRQIELIDDVRAESENIRLAWRWAVEQAKVNEIDKAAQTLIVFFTFQSRFQEAADEFEVAIRCLERNQTGEQSGCVLAELLNYCAWCHIRFGNYEQATSMLERSHTLYQRFKASPHPGWTTEPLVGLSMLAGLQGDYRKAEELGRKAYQVSEEREDRWELQTALYVMTSACFHQGRYQEARTFAEQADAISLEIGDQWFRAIVLNDLGRIAGVLGNYAQAKKYYSTSFAIREMFEDPQGMAAAVYQLGQIAMLEKNHEEAGRLYQESYDLYQDIGDWGGVGNVLCGLGAVACVLGEYRLSRRYYYQALQIANDVTYTAFIFSVLIGVSELLLDTGRYIKGLELLVLIMHHDSSDSEARERTERVLETRSDEIRLELGDEAYATAWERGIHQEIETVMQELLSEFRVAGAK